MTTSPPTAGLDAIELSVTAIEPDVPVEKIAETYTKLQGIKRRAKELEDQLDERLIAWIKANGEIRWAVDAAGHEMVLYLGHSKSVKCRDLTKACPTILETCGGDWDRFVNCLASGALKYGTVKKLLAEFKKSELYDELFETVTKDRLETGEPPKQLQKFDNMFVK